MDNWFVFAGLIVGSYLLGSLPLSYLIARSKGVELRKEGTQQVGAGNLWRTTSRKYGLMAGIFDFGKGMIMMWVASSLDFNAGQQIIVGLGAAVGHNWPVFLGFHGGRGAATSLGIVVITPILNSDAVSYWPSVIGILIVVVVTVIIRSSAVPVLLAAASLSVTAWLFGDGTGVVTSYLALLLILVIKRLSAQAVPEDVKIDMGHLLLNRLLFDRDISDRKAWMQRKNTVKKEP